MNEIKAEEQLVNLKAQDWHQTKDDERVKIWNRLKKQAYPSESENSKKMSNQDLDAWLRSALGG